MAKESKARSKTRDLAVSVHRVESSILVIRGERVILDADLAALYGASTKALNQAVRRNSARFPVDCRFRITAAEKAEGVANCDHLARLKFSPTLPFAFTEHGVRIGGRVCGPIELVAKFRWEARSGPIV